MLEHPVQVCVGPPRVFIVSVQLQGSPWAVSKSITGGHPAALPNLGGQLPESPKGGREEELSRVGTLGPLGKMLLGGLSIRQGPRKTQRAPSGLLMEV